MNEVLGKCPVCKNQLHVEKLACNNCKTKLEGEFNLCKFCRLSKEEKYFIEIFLKSRGNIREIEKELGLSYPTVRNKLDAVIEALGYTANNEEGPDRKEILERLDRGEISSQEAIDLLKKEGD